MIYLLGFGAICFAAAGALYIFKLVRDVDYTISQIQLIEDDSKQLRKEIEKLNRRAGRVEMATLDYQERR